VDRTKVRDHVNSSGIVSARVQSRIAVRSRQTTLSESESTMKTSFSIVGAIALTLLAVAGVAAAADPSTYAWIAAVLTDPHVQAGVITANAAAIDPDSVKAELRRIANSVRDVCVPLEAKQGELQARLQEVERKQARPAGGGGTYGGDERGDGSFAAAADQIVAGLRDTNSVRLSLAQSIRAALTGGSGGSVDVAAQRAGHCHRLPWAGNATDRSISFATRDGQ
jgi:hypothetical protein